MESVDRLNGLVGGWTHLDKELDRTGRVGLVNDDDDSGALVALLDRFDGGGSGGGRTDRLWWGVDVAALAEAGGEGAPFCVAEMEFEKGDDVGVDVGGRGRIGWRLWVLEVVEQGWMVAGSELGN
jgi:hypothetical protein